MQINLDVEYPWLLMIVWEIFSETVIQLTKAEARWRDRTDELQIGNVATEPDSQ